MKKWLRQFTTTVPLVGLMYKLSLLLLLYALFRLFYILPLDKTENFYYAINYDKGQYTLIEGFDSPIITEEQLFNYVKVVIGDMYNYTALNFITQFEDVVGKYFTDDARALYFQSMKPRFEFVVNEGLAVTGVPSSHVNLNSYGYVGKSFVFDVSVPVIVNYAKTGVNYQESILVRLQLVKVPTSETLIGLKILSIFEDKFDKQQLY